MGKVILSLKKVSNSRNIIWLVNTFMYNKI